MQFCHTKSGRIDKPPHFELSDWISLGIVPESARSRQQTLQTKLIPGRSSIFGEQNFDQLFLFKGGF